MKPKLRPNPFTCATALLAAVIATPAVGQVAPSASPAKSETTIVLSPFEIVAENDSYDATNTMGVTGSNREIRRLPLSMDAYTRTFIDEIGSRWQTDLAAHETARIATLRTRLERWRNEVGAQLPQSKPNATDQKKLPAHGHTHGNNFTRPP